MRGRGRAGRGGHGQRRQQLSNEIRATLVDHVINHGLTMREAGQRVQPNLSRFTVASVIRTFRLEYRYVTKISFTLCSTPHVILYQLGDTCLLHEWLMSYTNCTSFLYNLLYCGGNIFRLHCPSPIFLFFCFSKGLRDATMVEEGAKCSPGYRKLPL